MAKDATVQIRMDTDLKERAEALYRDMGTSFAEAVRIFARQSVQENGLPFAVTANKSGAYGRLSSYANPRLIPSEEGAFERAMTEKHDEAN